MINGNVTRLQIPRSYKVIRPMRTTTFNAGDLVPFFNMEIIPNDKISLNLTTVTNMTTPNFATMDTLYQHIAFFYCPNRLVWDNWDKFYGEGKNNDYETFVQLYIPQLTCPSSGWQEQTVADYFGIPTKKGVKNVSALPFRMFAMIYNEYYRDEQRQSKVLISKGDTNQTGNNGGPTDNLIRQHLQNGGHIPKACKLYDYFTGTKLEFQAGDPITIPVGTTAPVTISPSITNNTIDDFKLKNKSSNETISGISPKADGTLQGTSVNIADVAIPYAYESGLTGTANLSVATGISIRDFKRLLMLQQELQNIEDGGSRYIEQLHKRWGIYANELELEIPKFLGGKTTILNMAMVVATAGKQTAQALNPNVGELSGMSNTYDKGHIFTYHFKQHGYLFGIVTIRPYNTYENGIPKQLVKHSIDDFYKPEMAYFGPDIVRNFEIYSDNSDGKDDEMFGVRNYGDDLRFIPNIVTGQMRTNAQYSQAFKTYSINYSQRPLNNSNFIKQNENQIDKTLTITSATRHQFVFQAELELKMVRNLPKNPQAEQLIRL